MATEVFRSPVAFWLKAFLEIRRAAGRDSVSSAKVIRYLDRFLMAELIPGQPITREIAEKWMADMQHLSPGTRTNRRAFGLILFSSFGCRFKNSTRQKGTEMLG